MECKGLSDHDLGDAAQHVCKQDVINTGNWTGFTMTFVSSSLSRERRSRRGGAGGARPERAKSEKQGAEGYVDKISNKTLRVLPLINQHRWTAPLLFCPNNVQVDFVTSDKHGSNVMKLLARCGCSTSTAVNCANPVLSALKLSALIVVSVLPSN